MPAKMTAKVSIKSDNMPAMEENMRALRRKEVLVGFPAVKDKTRDLDEDPEKVTNAMLAYIHDKGQPANHIPARPFMNEGIARRKEKIASDLGEGAKMALQGNHAAIEAALNTAGLDAVSGIKQQIVKGPFRKLAERTLAERKAAGFKGTKPLVRTGQMAGAVNYVVQDR